jgi:hypothetical protein
VTVPSFQLASVCMGTVWIRLSLFGAGVGDTPTTNMAKRVDTASFMLV